MIYLELLNNNLIFIIISYLNIDHIKIFNSIHNIVNLSTNEWNTFFISKYNRKLERNINIIDIYMLINLYEIEYVINKYNITFGEDEDDYY